MYKQSEVLHDSSDISKCQEENTPLPARCQSLPGSDIRCQIGSYSFAEVQAVSYSVTREKAPIYTLGTVDPRSFSVLKAASPAPSSGSTSIAMPCWTWSINSAASSSPTSTTSGPSSAPTRMRFCPRTPSTPRPWCAIAARPLPPPSISSPACPSPPSPARRKRPAPGTPTRCCRST